MLQSCQTGLWGCEICFRWWPWFTGINLRCGFALPLYNTALFGGPCYVLVPDIGFSFMLFLCQYHLYYSFIHTSIYYLLDTYYANVHTRTRARTHTHIQFEVYLFNILRNLSWFTLYTCTRAQSKICYSKSYVIYSGSKTLCVRECVRVCSWTVSRPTIYLSVCICFAWIIISYLRACCNVYKYMFVRMCICEYMFVSFLHSLFSENRYTVLFPEKFSVYKAYIPLRYDS